MNETEREQLLEIRRGLPWFKDPIEEDPIVVAPAGWFKNPQFPTADELIRLRASVSVPILAPGTQVYIA